MFSREKINKIVLAFAFLLVLSACTRPTGIPADSDVKLSEEEDKNIDLKLKYYNRNCIDIFSGPIKLLHEDYMETVNDDPESMTEEDVPSLFELNSPSNCALAISKAKDLNLAQELDPLAESYLSALQNLIPLVSQATRYYDLMDYKTDDFLKGKELHPQLMDAFEAFEKADTNFRSNIQKTQTSLNLRFLEKFKQEDLQFEFLVQDAWVKGTALLYQVEDAESYDDLDLEKFTEAIDELQAALEALDSYLIDHPQQASVAEWYMDEAWNYLTELKELQYELTENLSEGNIEEILEEYEWWVEEVTDGHGWWKDEYFL